MRGSLWVWLATGAPGCLWVTQGDVDRLVDGDGDGYPGAAYDGPDCDDDDPTVKPGHQLGEVPQVVYLDADGDGAGDPAVTARACWPPPGWVTVAGDCDDGDAGVNPDTQVSDTPLRAYADADGDGFGDPGDAREVCVVPEGLVLDDTDCDDTDADVHAGLPQHADGDGDGWGDPVTTWSSSCLGIDVDHVTNGDDCNDERADVGAIEPADQYRDADGDGLGNPSLPRVERTCELAVGFVLDDTDCDDEDPDVAGPVDWWVDADQDGYGDGAIAPVAACGRPFDDAQRPMSPNPRDCDDTDPLVDSTALQFTDADGDLFGDPDTAERAAGCTVTPPAVADASDCDDTDASVNPTTAWWVDGDGDGLGDPDQPAAPSCLGGPGLARVAGDCDDADPAVGAVTWVDADGDGFGGAIEAGACDDGSTVGGDCDDTDPDRFPGLSWFVDADGDGYGDATQPPTASCADVPGAVAVIDPLAAVFDCDDTDATRTPATPWYADDDGDGFGSALVVGRGCNPPPLPSSRVGGDCDDGDADALDHGYVDADGDGWGGLPLPGCAGVLSGGDCDDTDADLYPGAEWYPDLDGDGFAADGSFPAVSCTPVPDGIQVDPFTVRWDCADNDPAVHPDTVWYVDADEDGIGGATSLVQCEDVGPGNEVLVLSTGDCDDGDDKITDQSWIDGDGDGYGNLPSATCSGVYRDGDCDDTDPARSPDTVWVRDLDGDGWANPNLAPSSTACTFPGSPYLLAPTDPAQFDCDENDPDRNPATAWWIDGDGDGLGGGTPTLQCLDPSDGFLAYVTAGGDCDDARIDVTVVFRDADGDGFGVVPGLAGHCTGGVADPGYSFTSDDCDDGDPTENPDARFWRDDDGDGFGGPVLLSTCQPDHGGVPVGGDCDDGDRDVNPSEFDDDRNGIDEDCDGTDLDGPDPDEWPDLAGCATVTRRVVRGPDELPPVLQSLAACDLVELRGGPYPAFAVPDVSGEVGFWAPDDGVVIEGGGTVGIDLGEGAQGVVLEGLVIAGFDGGGVLLRGDTNLTVSDVRFDGGAGIEDQLPAGDSPSRSVALYGTRFEDTDSVLLHRELQQASALEIDALEIVRVTAEGLVTTGGGIDANAVGSGGTVVVRGLALDHGAALGTFVRIGADVLLDVQDLQITGSLAGRAIELRSQTEVQLRQVRVEDNGFLGRSPAAVVELRSPLTQLDDVAIQRNLTEVEALGGVTWLAVCDGVRCDDVVPSGTSYDLAGVIVVGNASEPTSTALHLTGTGVMSQVAVHQQEGNWIRLDAGDVSGDHVTLGGRPRDVSVAQHRLLLAAGTTLALEASVVDYRTGDVAALAFGLGTVDLGDSVVEADVATSCGPDPLCDIGTGPRFPTGGAAGLRRSHVGMPEVDADVRLASASPAATCTKSGWCGAFAPDADPDAYPDTDGDGLLDDWEVRFFGTLAATPGGNPDGDLLSNLAECEGGTYPNVANVDGDLYPDGLDTEPFRPN